MIWFKNEQKEAFHMVVVVAQLVEWLLLTTEI